MTAATPAFELPTELAIDTDVARRIVGEFIRGQLRQAGFDRAVLGLSGGIDSALVAYLTAEAIGPDRLACVLMPYRTSSPASRSDAEDVVRRLADLAAATADLSVVVSFVEESADHRLCIAAALLEDGRICHVQRKLFQPTYGLFDERRFFAPGDLIRAVP